MGALVAGMFSFAKALPGSVLARSKPSLETSVLRMWPLLMVQHVYLSQHK